MQERQQAHSIADAYPPLLADRGVSLRELRGRLSRCASAAPYRRGLRLCALGGRPRRRRATLDRAERLAGSRRGERVEACYRGRATHPVFVALRDTAERFDLPIDPFRKLLRAFVPTSSSTRSTPSTTCSGTAATRPTRSGTWFCTYSATATPERQPSPTRFARAAARQLLARRRRRRGQGTLYVPTRISSASVVRPSRCRRGRGVTALRQLMKFEVDRARAMSEWVRVGRAGRSPAGS